MPASALPRGVQSVLVTSGQLRNLDPQLHVPPLLLANTLNAAFSRAALPRLAIPLLRHILRRAHPFRPNAFTFPPLIRAAPAHASVVQLHACALRWNGLANKAIEAYSRMQKHEGLKLGYVEPSVRPDDSRYGDNPNRLRRHTQFQAGLTGYVHTSKPFLLALVCAVGHSGRDGHPHQRRLLLLPQRPPSTATAPTANPRPIMSLFDLWFDRGHAFEDRIWNSLNLPVNFRDDIGQREFFLVVEFTRS
ncbi:pentatricopeptide repeat-containing protein [Hordeum vulgare]|nr:pentatricopeptide repeat-containing protein [Hordeum vulgare]